MGALANLYAMSDWSIQQLAIGLAMLPLLVGWRGTCHTRFIAAGCPPLYPVQGFVSQTIGS